MAYSATTYTVPDNASIGQVLFDLTFTGPTPGWLSRTHVWLYLNGTERGGAGGIDSDGFSWVTDTRVQLKDYSPVTGDTLEFRRIIPKTTQYVNFVDRSVINEATLDNNSLAGLYLAHEVLDGYGTDLSDYLDDAEAAASAAAASEAAAAVSETNAAASETAAGTSETNAAASAAAAATSETNAATSETNAAASETAAETAETNAEQAETNALGYAANASTYASNANTSAIAAALSESNASDSEDAAALSETNAAASEAAAEAAAADCSKRNYLINADFIAWQRGTSQTSNGYGSDDRWHNINGTSTKVHSQQTFTLGQTDVPNNPIYFSRTVVTTASGSSNYVIKAQKIEGVNTLAGETITLSFWAKADSSKNIAVEYEQYFGSGGSPSATVSSLGIEQFALTTAWQKFTATTTLPSISGKTLGSNGGDSTNINFWFDAGTNYNSRTNSLGSQSGTFDIAQVQVEKGSVVTEFEQRSIEEETSLCQRYFTLLTVYVEGYSTSGSPIKGSIVYPVRMRNIPSATENLIGSGNVSGTTLYEIGAMDLSVRRTITTTGSGFFTGQYSLDAEL